MCLTHSVWSDRVAVFSSVPHVEPNGSYCVESTWLQQFPLSKPFDSSAVCCSFSIHEQKGDGCFLYENSSSAEIGWKTDI